MSHEDAPEPPLEWATMVGEYQVVGVLGRGGFGAVYSAEHPLIGKHVAIKVLNMRFSADPQIVSRFVSEARAVNQIRHQHIIDIFSFGKLPDGRQYYVMELLDGETLDRHLRARGRLTVAQALQILRPIALALDAAHAAGIAHRDLKPENVFLARDADGAPFPKLLDFGIAKLLGPTREAAHVTATGSPMGTPLYMSPEQCRGRNVDHRTDVYSFGVMTYQLLTGALPFTGQDYMEIAMKQISEEPAPPSTRVGELTAGVDAAVLAMMAKDPAMRPPGLMAAVGALAAGAGIAMRPGSSVVAAVSTPPPEAIAPTVAPALESTKLPGTAAALEPTPTPPGPAANVSPSPSLAMGQLAPTPASLGASPNARGGRTWLIAAAAIVLVGGGFTVWKLRGGKSTGGEAEVAHASAATPPTAPHVDAAPAVAAGPVPTPPPPVAPAVDAAPTRPVAITVHVTGAPAGTRVSTADDVLLGTAPGDIHVPHGETPLELHFAHDGYDPHVEKILPLVDLPLSVTLTKKRPKPTTKPDEIGDFGR